MTHYPTRPIADVLCELDIRDLTHFAQAIAAEHGVTLPDLLGPRRVPAHVAARQHLWAELYGTGVYSLPVLGRIFDRDHKTVWHGIREHGNRAEAARLRKQRAA